MVRRIENTYAWIIATANSNIVRINLPGIARVKLDMDFIIKSPKSLIKRCPAIILAVSRIESVIGRITLLTSSISTIKFISGVGVPLGRVWTTIDFGKLIHPKTIIEDHKISAVENEIDICAVGVKINGHMARRFIKRITIKIDFKDGMLPFIFFLLISVLISFSTAMCTTLSKEVSLSWFFILLFM